MIQNNGGLFDLYILQLTTVNMLLKAFAVSLIILSIYFIGTILQRLTRGSPQPSQGPSYHLGCYESETNLNESKTIQRYLLNLTKEIAPYSSAEVKKHQQKVDTPRVKIDAANTLALQFKNYITAYENIKNLNEYEQSYNRGLRQARDSFAKCRDSFLQIDWDCNGSYSRYLQTDQEFTLIKSNLSVLIQNKYAEQQKIQKLLETDQRSNQEDYETYHNKIEELDKELARYWQIVKQKNQTLASLQNKEFKLKYDLNFSINQAQECERNKKEIETCKIITDRLKQVFTGIDLNDIQTRVDTKRKIIQKYSSALVKSKKLGLDTSEIKAQLAQNNYELNKLLQLYSQSQVFSLCSGDFIKKCSDQHVLELKQNITSIQQSLEIIKKDKSQIKTVIQNSQAMIKELNAHKDRITEEYQTQLGSIEKIREMQAINEKKLVQYKQKISKINFDIAGIHKNISQADQKRRKAIDDLNAIISRVGHLAQCLSKKDYLIKLQSNRPERREQDQKLKRQAAQSLIKVLRAAVK